MARKVHKLKFEEDKDFKVIAIASHENDYRLGWAINQNLNLNFVKTKDLLLSSEPRIEFSRFACLDKNSEIELELISNKSESGFLLKNHKNIDFIVKVASEQSEINQYVLSLIKKIRAIDLVITAFELTAISSSILKVLKEPIP